MTALRNRKQKWSCACVLPSPLSGTSLRLSAPSHAGPRGCRARAGGPSSSRTPPASPTEHPPMASIHIHHQPRRGWHNAPTIHLTSILQSSSHRSLSPRACACSVCLLPLRRAAHWVSTRATAGPHTDASTPASPRRPHHEPLPTRPSTPNSSSCNCGALSQLSSH